MDGSSHTPQMTDPEQDLEVFVYDAHRNHAHYAWGDLRSMVSQFRLVLTMVSTEFKSRYRGTLLGAFWLTATAAVTVLGLGLIYSQVFQTDFRTYLPYVALGMMVWALVSGFITESVTVFSGAATVFTQMKIPMSVFPACLTGRLMLAFFYRSLVIILILFVGNEVIGLAQILLALTGILIIAWVGFWVSMIFGILGARFKDFGQLMNAVMTFAFFMTPVFWESNRLGQYSFVAQYNPLYHFLNVVRGPLINHEGQALSFMVTGGFALLTPVLAFLLFSKFRHRLPYWC